jgi:hypothetical protein
MFEGLEYDPPKAPVDRIEALRREKGWPSMPASARVEPPTPYRAGEDVDPGEFLYVWPDGKLATLRGRGALERTRRRTDDLFRIGGGAILRRVERETRAFLALRDLDGERRRFAGTA